MGAAHGVQGALASAGAGSKAERKPAGCDEAERVQDIEYDSHRATGKAGGMVTVGRLRLIC